MSLELIKSSARIFGGSAVAGMGLSLGRDIYKGATKKDTKNATIGFIIIALAALGTYTGGVWLARNYQTLSGSVFKRIGSLFILVPSFAFLLFLGALFTGKPASTQQEGKTLSGVEDYPELLRLRSHNSSLVSTTSVQDTEVTVPDVRLRWDAQVPSMDMSETNGGEGWATGTQIAPQVWEFSQTKFFSLTLDFISKSFIEAGFDGDWLPEVRGSWSVVSLSVAPAVASSQAEKATTSQASTKNTLGPAAFILPCGVLAIGLLSGALQRGKRRVVWESERANALFMQQHGLVEHEDATLEETSTGQNYRIHNIGKRRITLMPIGRRGKRAYINIAPDGKYAEFTGMIHV